MPKFRMERQERGVRYTTYEVEAPDEEEAREMISEDEATIVSQLFKQHDADELSFDEVTDEAPRKAHRKS